MIKNHAIAVLQELKVRFISELVLLKGERSLMKCLKTNCNQSQHKPVLPLTKQSLKEMPKRGKRL